MAFHSSKYKFFFKFNGKEFLFVIFMTAQWKVLTATKTWFTRIQKVFLHKIPLLASIFARGVQRRRGSASASTWLLWVIHVSSCYELYVAEYWKQCEVLFVQVNFLVIFIMNIAQKRSWRNQWGCLWLLFFCEWQKLEIKLNFIRKETWECRECIGFKKSSQRKLSIYIKIK